MGKTCWPERPWAALRKAREESTSTMQIERQAALQRSLTQRSQRTQGVP